MVKILVALMTVLFFVFLIIVTPANGDQWDKKTIVTFNDAVEIPGQVLPAGTYVFRLADSISNRHIVQIWTEDGRYLIATILAVPAYRQQASDESAFNFDERPANSPMALRTWFYPGDNTGQEFVYDYHYNNEERYEARNQYNNR